MTDVRRTPILLLAALILLAATFVLATPDAARGTTVPLSPTAGAGDGASDDEVAAELPPPDLPTANQQGYTFDLKTSLKADLEAAPREAPVYELRREPLSAEQVQTLADKLAIGGTVEDRGDGTFQVTGTGELFASSDLIQYFSTSPAGDGDLPDDETAVTAARDWLRVAGLLPPDLGSGEVIGRTDEGGRVIVEFGPAEPANVLSGIPSIVVTLGPDALVIESSSRWPNVVRGDIYQLLPAEQAWQQIQSGQAYLDTDLSAVEVDPGSDVEGTATFSDISIAYASSGPPGGNQYLQPIYVFTGKLKVEGKDRSVPITAYLPALANSGAPVGVAGTSA